MVVMANSGYRNATGAPGSMAMTTARIAVPHPTRFIGPRKKPSGVRTANAIHRVMAALGMNPPSMEVK